MKNDATIDNEGGATFVSQSTIKMNNITMKNNNAKLGGAISFKDSNVTMMNNIISYSNAVYVSLIKRLYHHFILKSYYHLNCRIKCLYLF